MEEAKGNNNKASSNGHRYVFDRFEIDPVNRICRREGTDVPLTGRVFDTLLVFAQNPGRLLEKNELIEKVWHGEFVEDGNVARTVSTLRKALGDDAREHRYIATIQGHGYRFVADVERIPANGDLAHSLADTPIPIQSEPAVEKGSLRRNRSFLLGAILFAGLLTVGWIIRARLFTPAYQIKSLAVLPLRSLDSKEEYLGVGIADAVIRRISQTGRLTVRPTSAVLKYLNDDTDSLAAARQLAVDAVLEGHILHDGDRLRVSVNLLRTPDGASLWTDSFDLSVSDIFAIQDEVAQQVAARLKFRLDSPRKTSNEVPTSSTVAYMYYVKGIYSLDQRGFNPAHKAQMLATIEFFNKAIAEDPNYAIAHAQLGYSYVWTALFIEPTNPQWARLAREEIKRAQSLDPYLAESHRASAVLLWSAYEGFQNEAALRELLLATQLNPGVGHEDLAAISEHVGLADLSDREMRLALNIDPTSRVVQDLPLTLYFLRASLDDWDAVHQKRKPGESLPAWYLLRRGRIDDAEQALRTQVAEEPDNPELITTKGVFLALKGEFGAAEAAIMDGLARSSPNHPSHHHDTYDAACVYALAGNSSESVKWLRVTATTGFPNYPLFTRDHYLDRIRQTPEFVQFLSDQKAQWEELRQEFEH